MADRVQARPFDNWVDPRLRMLVSPPYVQDQLRLAGLINQRGDIVSYPNYVRGLARRERRRHQQDIITREIVARALQIDRSRRTSRRHRFEAVARNVVDRDFEVLTRQTGKRRPRALNRTRQKSAPGIFEESKDEEKSVSRVSSVRDRKLKSDDDLQPPSKLTVSTEERHACEVTMSYRAPRKSSTAQSDPNEIIVMQQHSNGENVIVFRGFIADGESFIFKSQRRSTSPFTLAFYANGFIDSLVQECCEYKYRNGSSLGGEHGRFGIERIRKANPCEKCRRDHIQSARTNDVDDDSSDSTYLEKRPQILRRRRSPLSPRLTVTNEKEARSKKQQPSVKSKQDNKKAKEKKQHTETCSDVNHEFQRRSVSEESVKEKKKAKQKKLNSKPSSSHAHDAEKKSSSVGSNAAQSKLVHETTSSIPSASSKASLSLSTKELSTSPFSKTIDKKRSPTPSQENVTIQQWVSQTHTGVPASPPNNDSSSSSATTIDAGNFLEALLAHLQNQVKNRSNRTIVERRAKSVENFIYVLDGRLQVSDDDMKKLCGLVNFGATFNDINDDACLEFMTNTISEQILLIISKITAQNLNSNIRSASQLRFIYILGSNEWPNDREKIRSVNIDMKNLCIQLRNDLTELTHDLTTVLSVSSDETTQNNFAYVQVLKEILLESDKKVDMKQDMLEFCREEYADNELQLQFIDEFDQHFRAEKAVNWYMRRETFIFKMLTRAFRTPDPDILFKLRFFIQTLHSQLQSKASIISSVVYRSQRLSKEDFDKMNKNQGGLLAFSQFFTAHKDRTVAEQTTEKSQENSESKLVMFEIDSNCAIANIESEKTPGEVLFTAATVFRISSVKQTDNDSCIVKLTCNDGALKTTRDVTKSMREAAQAPFPLLRMAKLMKEMEYTQHTERFCHMLVDDPIAAENEASNLVVGGLLHTLGTFYYERKEYDRGLEQLQKSLKVYLRALPPDDLKLTPTYNNMGSIYLKQGLHEKALEFHRKAYDMQVKSQNPDPDSVAAYAGNIGSVYIQQGKFDEAIPFLQRDLQIHQRLHPDGNNIGIAAKHHNLAGAYYRVQKFTEALEQYQMCLDLELKLHSTDHPTVAVTYHNMATALEGLGKLQEALDMVDKAITRLLMTKDEDDDEVKMNRSYATRVRQKLWVKEMFAST